MLDRIFRIYRRSGHIVINFMFMKITFKNPLVNQLTDCCCIPNLDYLKKQQTIFPHPVGIVIANDSKIGKNCTIYQNVTIAKKNGLNIENAPTIGDNVKIYANSCIIGDIKIGNNTIIGAGAVVLEDLPNNAIAVGNPAKVIRYISKEIQK